MIFADWNLEPAQLQGIGWLAQVSGRLVTPSDLESTSRAAQGRVYAYLVCSEGAQHIVQDLKWYKDVGWVAHKALALTIAATPKRIEGPTVTFPKSLPNIPLAKQAPNPKIKASRNKARHVGSIRAIGHLATKARSVIWSIIA